MVTASQQNLFRNNSADTLLFMRLPERDSEELYDYHGTVPEVRQGYPKLTALTVYQHLNPQNYTAYFDTT
jgi:hypothetical protein